MREFSWRHNGKEVDLGGTTAEVSLDAPRARLTDLVLPRDAKVEAQGQLDWKTGRWMLELDTTGLRLSESVQAALGIRLRGEGDAHNVVVTELNVADDSRTLAAKGEISLDTRQLHQVHLSAQWPDRVPDPRNGQNQDRGQWTADVNVAGTVAVAGDRCDPERPGREVGQTPGRTIGDSTSGPGRRKAGCDQHNAVYPAGRSLAVQRPA